MASLWDHNAPKQTRDTGSPLTSVSQLVESRSEIPPCHDLLTDRNLNISIGSHKFGPEQIRRVLDTDHETYNTTGQITDAIINAYLLLIEEECKHLKGSNSNIPDFVIADTLVTDTMSSQVVSNNFKPRAPRKFWFPEVKLNTQI